MMKRFINTRIVSKRFQRHKCHKCCSLYMYINEPNSTTVTWDGWYFELYKDYHCDNKLQPSKRENDIIRHTATINEIGYRTEEIEKNLKNIVIKTKKWGRRDVSHSGWPVGGQAGHTGGRGTGMGLAAPPAARRLRPWPWLPGPGRGSGELETWRIKTVTRCQYRTRTQTMIIATGSVTPSLEIQVASELEPLGPPNLPGSELLAYGPGPSHCWNHHPSQMHSAESRLPLPIRLVTQSRTRNFKFRTAPLK